MKRLLGLGINSDLRLVTSFYIPQDRDEFYVIFRRKKYFLGDFPVVATGLAVYPKSYRDSFSNNTLQESWYAFIKDDKKDYYTRYHIEKFKTLELKLYYKRVSVIDLDGDDDDCI
jgi:hypothetical protein